MSFAADIRKVERSFIRATAAAFQENKRLGIPTPIMRDGQIVRLAPEDIPDEPVVHVAEDGEKYPGS